MTSLFIKFYLGVLSVLFLAWCIHGVVLRARTGADRARVLTTAQAGGARLVASELDSVPLANRDAKLDELRARFLYPLAVEPVTALPAGAQRQFNTGVDVVYFQNSGRDVVAALLANRNEAVRLGPFANYQRTAIEDALAGWISLTVDKIQDDATRQLSLVELQKRFEVPIELITRGILPTEAGERLDSGRDVVFYTSEEDRWFAATPLRESAPNAEAIMVRFGPFPSFERNEQKAATTTLALVLLPAALAIALLLRPVARQLRQVENAAKAIEAGDLGARVNESRVGSARPLARAFNDMAQRTEALVRTQQELLQAVSHELRTPLSRIRFATDMLAGESDEAVKSQRLALVDTAVDELDELVEELLRYVRLETSSLDLHIETFAIDDILAMELQRFRELRPHVQFELHDKSDSLLSDGDRTIAASRLGFQRVIGNLISNASEHAQGRVGVFVCWHGNRVTIDVDDDGAGIGQADRERVFEPFVRLENATREQHSRGVGLGLAIVKRIVKQHGGSVEVRTSALGGCSMRTQWGIPEADNALPAV